MNITPTGETLGATVEGVDLNAPLDDASFARSRCARSGNTACCAFRARRSSAERQMAFSARFGSLEINVAGAFQEPGHPEVMILSNMKDARGRPIGARDAGQDWHTDMSYSETIAFANVLYALKVPRRDGEPLGGTEFANMHAAYDGLPDDLKIAARRDDRAARFQQVLGHDAEAAGTWRKPLTAEQRAKKPPVSHPVFLTHPITGQKVLYCNPGYAIRINELPEAESEEVLEFLFEHQLQAKYRYVHRWSEGDVLLWDDIGTLHNAHADYGPDEHRLIKRCQVMADRIFEPEWVRAALAA